MNVLPLGDMLIYGEIADMPPKILKALAIIAARLHPAYDNLPDTVAGHSKETCLFTSLAVRQFLAAIGYRDATVRPCTVIMRADDAEREIHSLGIGVPDEAPRPGKFNGHVAVAVPSLDLLIDPTLYQAQRPQWQGALAGMMVVPLKPTGRLHNGLVELAWLGMRAPKEPDKTFEIAWLDRPDILWKQDRDYHDARSVWRRRQIARTLTEAFGPIDVWEAT